MDIRDFFTAVEDTISADFRKANLVQHRGDRGGNREEILRTYLKDHLPKRYGVTKGEILSKNNQHTHSADVIIYDALNCPMLYKGETAILPIEGVYGIIELKSRLSKKEFLDASKKIENFKKLGSGEFSLVESAIGLRIHIPSRPFGIIFAYRLSNNSLDSLFANMKERASCIPCNLLVNLICVLGNGLLYFDRMDRSTGETKLLLDSDEFITIIKKIEEDKASAKTSNSIVVNIAKEETENRTFGRFLVYLLIMLQCMKVGIPDLAQYFDPSLPRTIYRES